MHRFSRVGRVSYRKKAKPHSLLLSRATRKVESSTIGQVRFRRGLEFRVYLADF